MTHKPENAERNAEIFRLYGEGFSYNAIAIRLGISRNVVAGAIHRAEAGNRGGYRHPSDDLTGKTFGRLLVLRRVGCDRHGTPTFLCECECLVERTVTSKNLKSGNTQSCGCLHKERVREAVRKRHELRRFGCTA